MFTNVYERLLKLIWMLEGEPDTNVFDYKIWKSSLWLYTLDKDSVVNRNMSRTEKEYR